MTSTHSNQPDENDVLLCSFCKKRLVERVAEYFPWTQEHWACPLCHSTYDITIYPSESETNQIDYET